MGEKNALRCNGRAALYLVKVPLDCFPLNGQGMTDAGEISYKFVTSCTDLAAVEGGLGKYSR